MVRRELSGEEVDIGHREISGINEIRVTSVGMLRR